MDLFSFTVSFTGFTKICWQNPQLRIWIIKLKPRYQNQTVQMFRETGGVTQTIHDRLCVLVTVVVFSISCHTKRDFISKQLSVALSRSLNINLIPTTGRPLEQKQVQTAGKAAATTSYSRVMCDIKT